MLGSGIEEDWVWRILAAMGTAIVALSGFILFILKRLIECKDEQIRRLISQAEADNQMRRILETLINKGGRDAD